MNFIIEDGILKKYVGCDSEAKLSDDYDIILEMWSNMDTNVKGDKRCYSDLIIKDQYGNFDVIELKYKTKASKALGLLQHGAHNLGRFDYLLDLCRIEQLKNSEHRNKSLKKFVKGYAIFLTNDPAYQKNEGDGSVSDAEFRLEEGRRIKKQTLSWNKDKMKSVEGTSRDRQLKFSGDNKIEW